MEQDALLEFYREQYILEIEQKKDITTRSQIILASLSAQVIVAVYIVKNITLTSSNILYASGALLLVSGVMWALSAWYVFRSFWGNEYAYLPKLIDIETKRQEILKNKEFEGEVDALLTNFLLKNVATCTSSNADINESRQCCINRGVKLMRVAVVPFAICGAIFLFLDLDASSPRKPTTVIIEVPVKEQE